MNLKIGLADFDCLRRLDEELLDGGIVAKAPPRMGVLQRNKHIKKTSPVLTRTERNLWQYALTFAIKALGSISKVQKKMKKHSNKNFN